MNENNNNSEKYLDGTLFARMAHGGAAHLRANAVEVNNLNVFPVPDGDTGDNMSMTIESGVAAIDKVQSANLAEVMSAMSKGMLLGARGNSGVILSQFFSGMAKGFEKNDRADPYAVGEALKVGVKQAYGSVLTPTEGTILTVAREAVDYAVKKLNDDSTIQSLFNDLTEEMYASLQRTPELLEVLREASVIDSGGAGLFYIMEGFNKALLGEEIKGSLDDHATHAPAKAIDFSKFDEDSELVYGYCTEVLLRLQRKKVPDIDNFDISVIREFLESIGNSIVSVRDGSIVKIHVHTMTPDKVLAFCRNYGEFLTIKIENMSLQHNETIPEDEKKPAPAEKPEARKERRKYGTVAVCAGRGIEESFRGIGVDVIVSGGQTNNPSTEDFIKAFDEVNADYIFVFPNNGNIVMAAKQAAAIYKNSDVRVIESKDLGAGFVAVSYLDLTADDPETAAHEAINAMENVLTGQVSTAIRDANMNGVNIENGDHICFVGKTVVDSKKTRVEAAEALIDNLLSDPSKFMLTIFAGCDATEQDNAELQKYIEEKHSDAETYFIDGDQEIYSYIIVAE